MDILHRLLRFSLYLSLLFEQCVFINVHIIRCNGRQRTLRLFNGIEFVSGTLWEFYLLNIKFKLDYVFLVPVYSHLSFFLLFSVK